MPAGSGPACTVGTSHLFNTPAFSKHAHTNMGWLHCLLQADARGTSDPAGNMVYTYWIKLRGVQAHLQVLEMNCPFCLGVRVLLCTCGQYQLSHCPSWHCPQALPGATSM